MRIVLRLRSFAALAALLSAGARSPAAPVTTIVSRESDGFGPRGSMEWPLLASGGATLVFSSTNPYLVAGDTNGRHDVFAMDVASHTVVRVSVASDGTQGDGSSYALSVTPDGRYVVFQSDATNLVPGDTDKFTDVFVHDTQEHTTECVSVSSDETMVGGAGTLASISADGRYVAFQTASDSLSPNDNNGRDDVYLRDRQEGTTRLVSVNRHAWADGGQQPRISGDGQYVVFSSSGTDLVAGDYNNAQDIFLRDVRNHWTLRLSTELPGQMDSGMSDRPTISQNGRIVAFNSLNSKLVPGDTNASADTFVMDWSAGTITRISVKPDGSQVACEGFISCAPELDSEGNLVVFESTAPGITADDQDTALDLFVRDLRVGTATRLTRLLDGSGTTCSELNASISADGAVVAYSGWYTVPTSSPSGHGVAADIFVLSLPSLATKRLSADRGWTQGRPLAGRDPAVNHDGSMVAFASRWSAVEYSSLQDQVALRNVRSGATRPVSLSYNGNEPDASCVNPSMDASGRYVVFTSWAAGLVGGDSGLWNDVFLTDTLTRKTIKVSIGMNGIEGNGNSDSPAISADGRYIAFHSLATNLVPGDTNSAQDVFVYDTVSGATDRVPDGLDGAEPNGSSSTPSLSADGRYVAFSSSATNLVGTPMNGVSQVFRSDLSTGATVLISVGTGGAAGSKSSGQAVISGDGHVVAFRSQAADLVADDANSKQDIFVRDVDAGTTARVSVRTDGTQGDGDASSPSVSADGRYVAFASMATNLVADDTNGVSDIFIRDRVAQTTRRISISTSGGQANGASTAPALSGDGNSVAYASAATNLDPSYTFPVQNVYLTVGLIGPVPYMLSDAVRAAGIAAGLASASAADAARLDLTSDGTVDISDAVGIARRAFGL